MLATLKQFKCDILWLARSSHIQRGYIYKLCTHAVTMDHTLKNTAPSSLAVKVSVEPDTVDSSRYWTLQTPIHALDTIWRILILSVSTTALEHVAWKLVHLRDEYTL